MLAAASQPAAMCQQGSAKHNVSSPSTGNISLLIAAIARDAHEWLLLKVISTNSANTSHLGDGDKQFKLKFNWTVELRTNTVH